jgi:hypothetical protein
MTQAPVTEALARQFLLGNVDDEERQRIESLFISDPESKTIILIAEDDLIEDYLEDRLNQSDRHKFLAQYADTPQQRRKLRIFRSIKEYAIAEARRTQTARAVPKWRIFLSALNPRNARLFIPLAVTVTIAVVVAFGWLLELNSRRTRENNQRLAIERELADLNGQSSFGELAPQLLSIVLPPVSLRGVGPQTELTPRADTRVIELRLLWTQKEQYPSYRAVLQRVGSTEQFVIPSLHLENQLGNRAVRVRVPAHLLSRGLYRVSLSGIADDGAPEPAEEYTFSVGG